MSIYFENNPSRDFLTKASKIVLSVMIELRKSITLVPKWKGLLMSKIETNILNLIQGLTQTQNEEALNYALAMLAAKQEKSPALVETSGTHIP